jgi:site-specific DNA recombinase
LKCGVCGSKARTKQQRTGYRTYICTLAGCTARRVEFVDTMITELAVQRLQRMSLDGLLDPERDDVGALQARVKLTGLRERLDGFVDQAALGEISPISFGKIESKLQAEIDQLEGELRKASTRPVLAQVAGNDAYAKWNALDIVRKREVIRALFSEIVMVKRDGLQGPKTFDPRGIKWEWVAP